MSHPVMRKPAMRKKLSRRDCIEYPRSSLRAHVNCAALGEGRQLCVCFFGTTKYYIWLKL
jgi:hypothetical protein